MTHQLLEERVGALEGDVSKLRSEVAVLGRDVSGVKSDVNEVKNQGVNILSVLQEMKVSDAARPQNTNWRTVFMTGIAIFGSIGGIATFVWWFVANSPAVQGVDKRVTRLDDPEVGKIYRMERQIEDLERVQRWTPNVYGSASNK